MDPKMRRQAVALAEQLMRTYYCQRDIDAVVRMMAPDVTWIGPGEREKKYTLEEMRIYFELGRDAVPPCDISDVDLREIDLGEDCCMVVGSMTVRTTPESLLILEVDQRVSLIFRFNGERLELVHLHNSNPYGEMKRDEYFPHQVGSQSYDYLQRILREKTEVIDMIAGNINGGLKGSNDDASFSYFYVNEGLPQMLGFGYDEFMEKTGGTAVGAVYPPDLPAALADCERCFAQGAVYSTEYRMEKKDGALIWVLDSGRKAVDNEGITRINSIITDITPLKQALFDLEVERERYRIALEHITGAMCEFDVDKDLFTIYQQVNGPEGRSVKKVEIPHFSQEIRSGTLTSSADGAEFLALCTGRRDGAIEFRTGLLCPDASWYWAQFSCSVILDRAGLPVRAIGMLKDITEEKLRNQELVFQAQRDGLTGLLNQTAAKEAIEGYLTERCGLALEKCALLMVDLDCFKEVNDSNGHLYGDEVLVKTARILEKSAGTGSIVGRIGGDEFIVLVKGESPRAVERLAERVIQLVREIGADRKFPISCSVGIASRNCAEEDYTQLFQRADRALYHAKDKGRDGFARD